MSSCRKAFSFNAWTSVRCEFARIKSQWIICIILVPMLPVVVVVASCLASSIKTSQLWSLKSDVSTVCCALPCSSQVNVENTHNRIFSGYMTCCKNSFITFIKLSMSRAGEVRREKAVSCHRSFNASFLRWTIFCCCCCCWLSGRSRLFSFALNDYCQTLDCAVAFVHLCIFSCLFICLFCSVPKEILALTLSQQPASLRRKTK